MYARAAPARHPPVRGTPFPRTAPSSHRSPAQTPSRTPARPDHPAHTSHSATRTHRYSHHHRTRWQDSVGDGRGEWVRFGVWLADGVCVDGGAAVVEGGRSGVDVAGGGVVRLGVVVGAGGVDAAREGLDGGASAGRDVAGAADAVVSGTPEGAGPPDPPEDSAASENIVSAPATATAPTPYTANRCCLLRARSRARPRAAARPPVGASATRTGGSRTVSATGGGPNSSAGVPHPGHEKAPLRCRRQA